jgi:hypothetical protein
MKTKVCNKCGKRKRLSMFYTHKGKLDGYLGKCKECHKSAMTINRNKNIERIRKYDRERGKLPHRIKRCVEYNRKRRLLYPERYEAHTKVNNAIRDGKLDRPDRCSSCNKKGKVMGHHHDYSKPFEVVWLCQPCHKQLHRDTF